MLPKGGTELLHDALIERLDKSILEKVQIVSRPEHLDDTNKKKVLWVHDLPADMPFLATPRGRNMFDGIVFVSSWQQQVFNLNAGVPFANTTVIKNAIEPIQCENEKTNDTIRLVYHPTPHRGLEILIPVFIELSKKYENLTLDVFSNFDLYARPELNKQYEDLYSICKSHEKINYHGTQPNSVVRQTLKESHIFAYPSIWRETSCLCALEAMSARCLTVAPNYGALAETLSNFSISYDFNENKQMHAAVFAKALESAIELVKDKKVDDLLTFQKSYVDSFYNWDTRIKHWEKYLSMIIDSQKKRDNLLTWN